ncbi:hypothetical protein F0L17_24790 [Streptomyces sp. TRM43335]|uniref:Uncharacterized protein n=1 Tax=Streptomyces taklimakanensis TaxID=2569853 RepID=A0A6G2BJ38_9ACTN|nr:hypothetical protein [Streptomyces taklimakanensis]MTE22260.1 hypothetical protein [Streptomyces taklimakanensis]
MDDVRRAGRTEKVEKIVRTCLYEGYLLWPYRRSAPKNTKRWTFGGVFPRACASALGEPDRIRTEVLLDAAGRPADRTEVTVRVRFLHVVDRGVVREGPAGPEPVAELTVDGERHLAWQEATEREVRVPVALDAALDGPVRTAVDIPAGTVRESIVDRAGRTVGALLRRWNALSGTVEIGAAPVTDGVYRLAVRVENTTPCPPPAPEARDARERACAYAFVATHTVLHSDTGRFVSLLGPPERLRTAASGCRNQGTWPVLVDDDAEVATEGAGGDGGAGSFARTVLSSPVTLYDFLEVAPESLGDLFDGTRTDRLPILGAMSPTEEERREARAANEPDVLL